MAEESVPLKPDVVTRPYGGNSKRNSLTGGACSVNVREEKALPHYRRASIGTCHDVCKYGKKHESDHQEKARYPFQERIAKKLCDDDKPNFPQQRKNNTSVMKSKSFSDSRTRTPNASEVIKLQVSTVTVSPDRNNSTTKEKATLAKLKSKHSLNSRSHSHDLTFGTIKLEVPTDSSESKTSRENVGKRTSMANLLPSPSLKSKEKSFSVCHTTSSKLKSRAEKLLSEGLDGRRNSRISDTKMGKSTTAATSFKASLKKVLALPRKSRNLKVVPLPQKYQNKVNKMADQTQQQPSNEHHERGKDDTLQEKTLYVIQTENILLTSDHHHHHKNEKCAAELSPPPEMLKLRPNNESGYAVTEAEEDCDSEYDEDVDAVRLKLRRGGSRVLGENQNMKADRRTFRTREEGGEMNDNKLLGGEKVVLRQQDVEGKKDEEGLFNNVIEETANKLVETRKGKVKALVGAFESIISLQDTNLSAKIQYHCTFSQAD